MIFVDTNVFMYAVGRRHPLQPEARQFFLDSSIPADPPLLTSAEVLQELLHAYLPVGRLATFDSAMRLVESQVDKVLAVEMADVQLARRLADSQPALGGRDLLHLACCHRRQITRIKTFDRGLAAALDSL